MWPDALEQVLTSRRSPRGTGRTRISGEVLRAEALKLVRARPGAWTVRGLSSYLGHRYRLSPALVRDLLEQAPEFRRAEPPPTRPVPLPARSAHLSPPVRSWTSVVQDLALWLSEADTDAIHVEVPANTIAPLDLRFDFRVRRLSRH